MVEYLEFTDRIKVKGLIMILKNLLLILGHHLIMLWTESLFCTLISTHSSAKDVQNYFILKNERNL